jgi:molybdopterin-guanine dinucleotide biosynthesis protein A
VTVSAIILAGGRSSRFGRDKLAEPIDGAPMLWRTVEAVRAVAADIVVVVAPGSDPALPGGVRVARDPSVGEGPLVGLLTGLEVVDREVAIVVGGDMPWVRADVIASMVSRLDGTGGAVALEIDGRAQQLPLAVRREAALDVARRLVASGERRLGAFVETIGAATIREADWRAMDPDADTLRDIDVPEDLPAQR